MDGDIFGAVSRLGRDAADGVVRAVAGQAWDPFLAQRCLEVAIEAADGVPSLPPVLAVFRSLADAPLLASTMIEGALEAIRAAVSGARRTILDLILRSAAERFVLAGNFDARSMLGAFCLDVLDRAVITSRRGFVELEGGGPARRSDAHAVLEPVASEAAIRLEAKPETKRLGLSRKHTRLKPDSDLLGGGDE